MICVSGFFPSAQAGKRLLNSSDFPDRGGAKIIRRGCRPAIQSSWNRCSAEATTRLNHPSIKSGFVRQVNSKKLRRASSLLIWLSVGSELSTDRLQLPQFLDRQLREVHFGTGSDHAAVRSAMLDPILEHAERAAEVDQRGPLVRELHLDPPDVAGILAAPFLEVLDRQLDDGGRLLPRQGGEVEVRVAIGADADIVVHVG